MGSFFDVPETLLRTLAHYHIDYNGFMFYHDIRVRMFTNFFVGIPFSFLKTFLHHQTLLNYMRIYSTSYFIIHFCALALNFILVKRTKRYDIAIIAFAFYCIVSMPNYIWACREMHIAILLYFCLLQYFLTKEETKPIDWIISGLLSIYLFESFEISAVYGLILFFFAKKYVLKPNCKNPWLKCMIGTIGLLVPFYVVSRLLYFHFTKYLNINGGAIEWFMHIKDSFMHLLTGNIMIFTAISILVIASLFYKKEFNKKSIIFFVGFLILFICCLGLKTHFVADVGMEIQASGFALLLVFPVILLIMLSDYFNKDINNFNSAFLPNLFVIACISGILNLSWQIHSCIEYRHYSNYLKFLVKNSQTFYTKIPEEDYGKYDFLNYNTCYGLLYKSLIYSDSYKIKTLLIPPKQERINLDFCYATEENNRYIPKYNGILIQGRFFPIKTRFWDLSLVKEEYLKSGYNPD
jgi:hypothetical protein